jgi:NLR family CARD domain-containing protein 3
VLNVARDPEKPRYRSLLESRSDAEVLAALKDRDPIVRTEAAEALRTRQDDPAAVAAALLECLKDENENVRVAAAQSLVRFGKYSRVAVTTFIEWLEAYNQPPAELPEKAPFPGTPDREGLAVPRAALAALAGMGEDARPALPAVVKTALSPIADRDKELQKRLGLVMQIIGVDAAPALVAEMKKGNAEIRARAARAISRMELVGAVAIPDLIELSKSVVDSDAQAAFSAIQAMGPVAYPIAGRHLVEVLLTDLFAERRKWAAYALGDLGVPGATDSNKSIDALQTALLDPDEAVCRAAHSALVKIGAPALPRLRELLKLDEGQASYWWAVRVMARMKADPSEVIPRLIDFMQPGVRQIKEGAFAERGTAAELLGEYAPAHPEIIPVLMRMLGDREDYVARAAISIRRQGRRSAPEVAAPPQPAHAPPRA